MRGLCVFLAMVLLAPAFAFLPPAPATAPPAPQPRALTRADVPTWLAGDSWTYSADANIRSGTDAIELHGNLTLTVTGRLETLLGGSYLYLYNSTTTGDVHGSGTFTDPTFGAIPFTITTGTIQGYTWNERGDLSVVKTNLTLSGSGSVDLPIVGSRPLQIQGAVTVVSNPPEEDLDFPIALGDAWRMSTTLNMAGFLRFTVRAGPPFGDQTLFQPLNGNTPLDAQSWANTTESVVVPAGTFEAFRIDAAATGGGPASRWYAPNASNLVRFETSIAASPTLSLQVWANLTSYSPTNPAINVFVTLLPDLVGPGAPFEVQADTNATNATVRVIIPATNFTAAGATDSAGRFRMNVSAPVNNDNTPADTDIGSHGVLVEVTKAGEKGFGAATITLFPPDLTVSGLSAGPPPVGDGIPTDVRATVSVTTGVALYAPVNVTFVSENVDMNYDGVLDYPLDVYCARGSCIGTVTVDSVSPSNPRTVNVTWIPAPPAIPADVTVSAIVDPRNRWAELNERNNIAVASVRVEGPDLAVSNVTAEVRGSRSVFDNPAALGFVSPLINAPMGATVNLTARVRNAGPVNASRPTVLAMYNTTTLNGTGDVPFSQTTVPALSTGAEAPAIPASWTAPSAPGMYYVNVTADHGNALRETSETDNTFVLQFRVFNATALPDLVPVSVDIPAKASVSGNVTISVRVENRGAGDASGFHVAFLDGPAGPPIVVLPLGPLPAGATSVVATASWPATPLGPHAVRIAVDWNDEVPESDETDNTAAGSVTVVDVPATTLTIGTPSVVAANTTYLLPTTPLRFTAVEHTDLGPATIGYAVDTGPWTAIAPNAPLTLPAGPHTVRYNSTDLLGGVEPTRSRAVFVDDRPPRTTAAVSNATGGKQVTLLAFDEASGVDWTEYRIDNGSWARYDGAPFLVSGAGAHVVEFHSADRLGNVEPAQNLTVSVAVAGTGVQPFNLKPFLALAFVIALLVAGWLAAPSDEPARRRRWFLTVVAPPAALEAFTGVASIGVSEMAVPSGSLGLPVDLALLVLGLLVIVFSRRRALRNL